MNVQHNPNYNTKGNVAYKEVKKAWISYKKSAAVTKSKKNVVDEYIYFLNKVEGRTLTEIASMLGCSHVNIIYTINKLENKKGGSKP